MSGERSVISVDGFEISTVEAYLKNASSEVVKLPYRSSDYILIYLTNGNGVHEIDYISYPLKSNEIIFIARNRLHCFKDYKALRGYIISFTEGFYCEMFSEPVSSVKNVFDQSLLTPHMKGLDVHAKVLRNILDLLLDGVGNKYEIVDRSVLASIFNGFAQLLVNIKAEKTPASKRHNEKLLEFSQLIDQHLVLEKTVEGYARLMHTSKKTLNLLTRRSLDVSAKQFIDQKLMTVIQRKLSFEEKSINEIAYNLGFSEPSNMTRFFKQHLGVSPKVFRENVRHHAMGWIKTEELQIEKMKGAIEKNVYYISPSALVPLHKHDSLDEVFYCMKGNGYAVLQNEERALMEGETFVAHADVLHSLRSEQGMYVLSVLVPILREKSG